MDHKHNANVTLRDAMGILRRARDLADCIQAGMREIKEGVESGGPNYREHLREVIEDQQEYVATLRGLVAEGFHCVAEIEADPNHAAHPVAMLSGQELALLYEGASKLHSLYEEAAQGQIQTVENACLAALALARQQQRPVPTPPPVEGHDDEVLCDLIGLVLEPPIPLEVIQTWTPAEKQAASDWA